MRNSCVLASASSAEPQPQAQLCLKAAISLGIFVFNSLFYGLEEMTERGKPLWHLELSSGLWCLDSNIFGEKTTISLIPWDKS